MNQVKKSLGNVRTQTLLAFVMRTVFVFQEMFLLTLSEEYSSRPLWAALSSFP